MVAITSAYAPCRFCGRPVDSPGALFHMGCRDASRTITGGGREPDAPSSAPAGSDAKIAALADRAARRVGLHHPADLKHETPPAPVEVRTVRIGGRKGAKQTEDETFAAGAGGGRG